MPNNDIVEPLQANISMECSMNLRCLLARPPCGNAANNCRAKLAFSSTSPALFLVSALASASRNCSTSVISRTRARGAMACPKATNSAAVQSTLALMTAPSARGTHRCSSPPGGLRRSLLASNQHVCFASIWFKYINSAHSKNLSPWLRSQPVTYM